MDAIVNFDPHEDAYSKPLDKIDVSVPELYQDDIYQPYFERLRREDPVHFCEDSAFGPYWSVTRYKDIMTIAVNHQVFSSHWELRWMSPIMASAARPSVPSSPQETSRAWKA
jgi:cytochrome P450